MSCILIIEAIKNFFNKLYRCCFCRFDSTETHYVHKTKSGSNEEFDTKEVRLNFGRE